MKIGDVELIIKMPEEVYKSIINGKNYISYQEYVEEAIKNGTPLPDILDKAIFIPKNATNGDMIEAMFPYIEVKTHGVITSVKGLDCDKGALDSYRHFWSEWWNAPYKAERSNEE